MPSEISERPVVVTGGGNGIGAALAEEAIRRGASAVVVADIELAAATEVAERIVAAGGQATAHQCDVADPNAVDALAEEIVASHGVPGVVFANAGVMAPTSALLDVPAADIEWLLGVNVRGVIHTLQSFGRRMAASETGGWLMATASEHALGVPHIFGAPYTASKHAVLGACDVLRGELPEHVGVSVLCPGLTTSQLWNSTSTRPDRFGGSSSGDPGTGDFMESSGMDADVVARRAFDGAEAGHFMIPTHYNARAYAAKRAAEIEAAFDRLAEIDTADYDVGTLAAELMARLEAESKENGT